MYVMKRTDLMDTILVIYNFITKDRKSIIILIKKIEIWFQFLTTTNSFLK